jgi:hypothetical protein
VEEYPHLVILSKPFLALRADIRDDKSELRQACLRLCLLCTGQKAVSGTVSR